MNEPTGNVVFPSSQGSYVSEINLGDTMLSPFLVWASKSEITLREENRGWAASASSGVKYSAGTREQAAELAAKAESLETYDEWRLRLSRARASWHYPLWKVVSGLPGGKRFIGLAVGVTRDEVRHFLDDDGFAHEGEVEVSEVRPESISSETELFGSTSAPVMNALRRGSCGLVLSMAAG